MKKKTAAISLLVLIFMISGYSQKTTFAISAGYCGATYFLESNGSSGSDFKSGFYTGANLRSALGKHWHFEPGLLFVQKGGLENVDDPVNGSYKSVVNLNYVEMPLNFVYSKRNLFFFGLGPSIGFGVSGKQKLDYNTGKETFKIKFGNSSDDDLKRVDIGLSLLVGRHFMERWFWLININTAFNNISNDSQYFSNNYMCLGLGYTFKSKKN
jgi:hypothetical protein